MERDSFDCLARVFAMFVVFPLAILHREWLETALVVGWVTLVLAGILWVGQQLRDGLWLQLGGVLGWFLYLGRFLATVVS